MGRKTSLCSNKWRWKKPTSLVVSVPLSNLPAFFQVSLPTSIYEHAPVAAPKQLYQRALALGVLPSGWTTVESTSPELTLVQLKAMSVPGDSSTAHIKFSLTVSNSLHWTLTIYGRPITAFGPSTLLQLSNAADLSSLLNTLQSSTVCTGNNDSQFIEVCKRCNRQLIN